MIRAGAGFFYDRFSLGNELAIDRNNGTNQQLFTLSSSSSTASTITACNPSNISACTPLLTAAGRNTIRQLATGGAAGLSPNLRAPYQIQINVGVDQQLARNLTMSVNYQHIRGVHQFNLDVPNPNPAGVVTTAPLVYQYQSNGVFNQDQLVTNVNYRGKFGTLGSYYVLNFAKGDTSGGFASVPNHLGADYGRTTFDVRNRVVLFGSFTLPHLVSVSPFLIANSGTPYNILSGLDPYHDNTYNARALLLGSGVTAATGAVVKTINGCGTFASNPTGTTVGLAPINDCTGPGSFTLNLRVNKTFGFGGQRVANANAGAGGGDQGGGRQRGGPGGPGGPGGGGGGRGGGGGFGGGGGTSSGKKYNLTIGAQAANLLNVADRSVPVGTITSPLFGQSTQLAGGIFTTDSAIRRVTLNLSFNF